MNQSNPVNLAVFSIFKPDLMQLVHTAISKIVYSSTFFSSADMLKTEFWVSIAFIYEKIL